MKVFPQARPQNDCPAGLKIFRTADSELLCDQLAVEGYLLDDTQFHLSFMFNPDGTLRYVSLIKFYGSYAREEDLVSADTIKSTFTSLADLVSSKYGPAVAHPPGTFLDRGPMDSRLEWQPGRGTRWQSGGDRISLTSQGDESKVTPGQFRGRVHLFYSFARRSEFDRF